MHKKRLLESQKGPTTATGLDSASPHAVAPSTAQQPSPLLPTTTTTATHKIKRNKTAEYNQTPPSTLLQMPAWKQYEPKSTTLALTAEQHEAWLHQSRRAVAMVEVWMERFRQSRLRYWRERRRDETHLPPPPKRAVQQDAPRAPVALRSELSPTSVFGAMESTTPRPLQPATQVAPPPPHRCESRAKLSCQDCVQQPTLETKTAWFPYQAASIDATAPPQPLMGDDLMQCLECSHVGCAPASVCGSRTNPASQQHALQHFLTSRHRFGE
jgi:Zn-finger in ubiquitin-hydrolases and other protein